MKFSCERCGKRYATAETPAPGRVYKIRCKACGHLIVVKGSAASSSPAATAVAPASASAAPPAAAPSRPGPRPPEPLPELTPARLAAALRRPDPPPPPPPPAEAAFVDLFADLGAAGPDLSAPPADELRTPPPEPLPQAAAPAPAPAARLVVQPAQQKKGRGPVVLIALGALVLVGILAFVLLGGGGPPPPVAASTAPQPRVEAPPPAIAPPAAVAGGDAPPAVGDRRPSRDGAGRGRARQPGGDDSPRGTPAASGRITQSQIQKVLARSRRAFQDCIAAAARSGDVKLDGRRLTLRLNVQANGAVTYPSIDDATLDGSDLGACLKSSARMMEFPKFAGEAVRVDVPLVLPRG